MVRRLDSFPCGSFRPIFAMLTFQERSANSGGDDCILQGVPLPVISSGVITPLVGVITLVAHLFSAIYRGHMSLHLQRSARNAHLVWLTSPQADSTILHPQAVCWYDLRSLSDLDGKTRKNEEFEVGKSQFPQKEFQGSLHYLFGVDPTMQMYGNFEGFLLKSALLGLVI